MTTETFNQSLNLAVSRLNIRYVTVGLLVGGMALVNLQVLEPTNEADRLAGLIIYQAIVDGRFRGVLARNCGAVWASGKTSVGAINRGSRASAADAFFDMLGRDPEAYNLLRIYLE